MKEYIKRWLGITSIEDKVEMFELYLLHQQSRVNGFFVLKKHLQRPDKPLPSFMGKEIEQD